jgi:outer membrane protein assembly factor BamE (lipoprotein component of BamABCDE complex)
MVDDFLAKHKLRGMTKQEIVELLGEPDDTDYFSNWDMVYWLGPERGFMQLDSEWLVIDLDDLQRVSEYRLVTD